MPAPLALFVYKRAAHTARTIAALKTCDGFAATAVTVFADGAKTAADADAVAAVRALVTAELPAATLVAAPANRGLAASIIAGVNALVGDHGRVIVVEDDLVVAPDFLTWMNAALDHYVDDARVMQISGHMFDVAVGPSPVFLPFISSWGWATWARAWAAFDAAATGSDALDRDLALRHRFDLLGAYDYSRMLARQKARTVDSWAIRWYWSVFRIDGLALYPPTSRVDNIGFDAEATHTRRAAPQKPTLPVTRLPVPQIFPVDVATNDVAFRKVRAYLKAQTGVRGQLGRIVAGLTRRRVAA